MSLNKFMHPRNKYRKPPDFKALAIKYPEFRQHAKQDISGKVSLNFKDPACLRVLTQTLLKEDFDLDVEIPLTRLIPTLPLRLNYLLWIEDLLASNKTSDVVRGIDIGCGASCVYPLLAAKHFGWHMLGTEVDVDSAFTASANVRKNNLQHMVKVRTVEKATMLDGVLEPDTVYDFCVCNPPFFSSVEELDPKNVARSPSRPPPRNAQSGTPDELVVPGGEVAFIARIIQDSVKLKGLVRIYSVMVGHKTSVGRVKQDLREAGVSQVASTEFCQGHTTRWGVVWTLEPTVTLPQVNDVPLSAKKKTPFTYDCELDLTTTVDRLHTLMTQLQISYSTLKSHKDLCAMEITAMANTWHNSRKKRRQAKLNQTSQSGSQQPNVSTETTGSGENGTNTAPLTENKGEDKKTQEDLVDGLDKNTQGEAKSDDTIKVDNSHSGENENKRKLGDVAECSESNPPKRLKTENVNGETNCDGREPFLFASLVVRGRPQGSTVELCWVRGTGGRDAAHQVLQYFKNNLKTH